MSKIKVGILIIVVALILGMGLLGMSQANAMSMHGFVPVPDFVLHNRRDHWEEMCIRPDLPEHVTLPFCEVEPPEPPPVVPIPGALWLFGSAVGLLLWRKK